VARELDYSALVDAIKRKSHVESPLEHLILEIRDVVNDSRLFLL
jgi:hypothetical protein